MQIIRPKSKTGEASKKFIIAPLACLICWCSPQGNGYVRICEGDPASQTQIKIRDSNGQSYSNSSADTSTQSHTFNNVTATPKPGQTWGSVDSCDDIDLSCS